MEPPTPLEAFRAGAHEQVWAQLTQLSDRVWDEPVRSQAVAIARETMHRVRANIEWLIPRLKEIGYCFSQFSPLKQPESGASNLIDEYEKKFNVAVPLSLRAFYEVVGAVDLRGGHPDWDGYYDPLQIYGMDRTRADADRWDGPITKIYLCPDFLMKEEISGCGPLYIVPGRCADAPVSFEGAPMPFTFVQYLRNFFRWGGFAGCVTDEEQFATYPDSEQHPPTDLAYLKANLVSF